MKHHPSSLLVLLSSAACSQALGLDEFGHGEAGGSGTVAAAQSSSSQGGGSAASTTAGPQGSGGTGAGGGNGGSGGVALLCDAGWSFTPDPPIAGQQFEVTYTDWTAWVYVSLEVMPDPGMVTNGSAVPGPPAMWNWFMVASANTYHFQFTHKTDPNAAPIVQSTCTKAVVDQ